MATKSSEIKKALRKAFPTIKFSVTYKHPYGYTVKWENGIIEGATTEAVEAIAKNWDTSYREELGGGDCYYGGDSVRYEHDITDKTWKQFVIDCVLVRASSGVYYDEELDTFKRADGRYTHWENVDYSTWLYNGIKTDLSSYNAISDRDTYYQHIDEQKIDDLIAEERRYLSHFTVEPEFNKYVGQETETIKVVSVQINLKRPDYKIYNREIVYDIYSETIEKPKPFSECETELQFTILNKESGEESKADLDGILNIFDPITPIVNDDFKYRFNNKYAWDRKINNFKNYSGSIVDYDHFNTDDCWITNFIELSPEHYDRFSRQLLNNYEWLADKGGNGSEADFDCRDYSERTSHGVEATSTRVSSLSEAEKEMYSHHTLTYCVFVFSENKKGLRF